MKMKAIDANSMSKQEVKYLTSIEDYFVQIKQIRVEMKRSRVEINRLKAASCKRLAEIDAILKPC